MAPKGAENGEGTMTLRETMRAWKNGQAGGSPFYDEIVSAIEELEKESRLHVTALDNHADYLNKIDDRVSALEMSSASSVRWVGSVDARPVSDRDEWKQALFTDDERSAACRFVTRAVTILEPGDWLAVHTMLLRIADGEV